MSDDIEKHHCPVCRRQTNQVKLLHETSTHQSTKVCSDPEVWVSIHTLYKVMRCMGCEHISLNCWKYDSEMDREFDAPDLIQYPPVTLKEKPEWHYDLPADYQSLFNELYVALAYETNRLALMGCRTLIDMYLTEKVGDIGGFEKKMNVLFKNNGISSDNRNTVLTAIEAGSAASHRSYEPDKYVLLSVVRITENLLEQLALEKNATTVSAKTPRRKKANAKVSKKKVIK